MPTYVSPYIFLNGIGLIVALLLLDRRLEREMPDGCDLGYVLLVSALVPAWMGAHLLDWLVSGRSFGNAGFVFYGGLASGVACFLAASRVAGLPRTHAFTALESSVVPFVVAHGIGRVGCFLAGCCYGKLIPETAFRHPTQLYESAFLFCLAFFLVSRSRPRRLPDIGIYLLSYPVFRFFAEFVRADEARGAAFGMTTSQWVSIGLALVGVVLCCGGAGATIPSPSPRRLGRIVGLHLERGGLHE